MRTVVPKKHHTRKATAPMMLTLRIAVLFLLVSADRSFARRPSGVGVSVMLTLLGVAADAASLVLPWRELCARGDSATSPQAAVRKPSACPPSVTVCGFSGTVGD